MLKTISILTAMALAAGGAAAPAMAKYDDQPHVEVAYGDLDLATAEGRERLNNRVESAIRSMCGSGSSVNIRERAAIKACETTARRSAEPQLAALLNGSNAKFAGDRPPVVAAP